VFAMELQGFGICRASGYIGGERMRMLCISFAAEYYFDVAGVEINASDGT
jgi:hypothetical protein